MQPRIDSVPQLTRSGGTCACMLPSIATRGSTTSDPLQWYMDVVRGRTAKSDSDGLSKAVILRARAHGTHVVAEDQTRTDVRTMIHHRAMELIYSKISMYGDIITELSKASMSPSGAASANT